MTVGTAEKKAKCYYLNRPFTRGSVFDYLTDIQFDVFVGIDFGHGECVAYKCFRGLDGTWQVRRLRMNYEDDAAIPTYIAYSGGRALIGHEVERADDFLSYFKVPPSEWDSPAFESVETVDGETRAVMHSSGEVIHDFIGRLWQDILRYDEHLAGAVRDGRAMLAVGCPSGAEWTGAAAVDRYTALVKSATGCAHVSVLPESNAAIMAPVSERADSTRPIFEKGAAIYDLGSSTIDFTFVLMGRVLITRSLYIGGSDIDRQMLDCILEDNGLTRSSVGGNLARSLIQLRQGKEQFYRRGGSRALAPQLLLLADGSACRYCVDGGFMRRVLWERKLGNVGDATYSGLSWGGALERFILETGSVIGEYGCSTVILTGGTSFVSDVVGLVSRAYPGTELLRADDPSASVAKGLCYAKHLEADAAAGLHGLRVRAAEHIVDCCLEMYTELSEYTTGLCLEYVKGPITDYVSDGVTHRVNDIVAAGQRALGGDERLLRDLEAKLYGLFRSSGADCMEKLLAEVNEFSRQLYGVRLEKAPAIKPDALPIDRQLLDDLQIRPLIKQLCIDACVWLSGYSVVHALLTIIGTAICLPAGAAASYGGDALRSLLTKLNFKMSPASCARLAEGLEAPDPRYLSHMSQSTLLHLSENKPLGEAYGNMMSEQLEIALGKILFLVFDEQG